MLTGFLIENYRMFRKKTEQNKFVRELEAAHQNGVDQRGPIDDTVTGLRGMSEISIFAGKTEQHDRHEVELQRTGTDHGRVRRGHGAQNVSAAHDKRNIYITGRIISHGKKTVFKSAVKFLGRFQVRRRTNGV